MLSSIYVYFKIANVNEDFSSPTPGLVFTLRSYVNTKRIRQVILKEDAQYDKL